MATLRLAPDALEVESFTVAGPAETDDTTWKRSVMPPSCLPMCTDQSCTGGFPDCETWDPDYCPPSADGRCTVETTVETA